MIKRIGLRRLLILAFLGLINLLIVAGYVFVVLPAEQQAQADLNVVNGQISDASSRLQSIRSDLVAFQGNYDRYQDLEKSGFFSNQDRFSVARALDSLREKANLLGFSYNIDAIKSVTNSDAEASNANLFLSQIKIDNIASVFDMNIYNFVQLLNAFSLQHVRVDSFEIRRALPMSKETLDLLAKEKIGLVNATLTAEWYTMVPKVDPSTAGAAGADEFRGR